MSDDRNNGKICERCGSSRNIQVHHVSHDSEGVEYLCWKCHNDLHRKRDGHGAGGRPLTESDVDEIVGCAKKYGGDVWRCSRLLRYPLRLVVKVVKENTPGSKVVPDEWIRMSEVGEDD